MVYDVVAFEVKKEIRDELSVLFSARDIEPF